MDESQVYFAESKDQRFEGHGLAMMILLAFQGAVWFGIGLAIGLLW